ncbi:MAG: dephospho-CoA kinase [Acidobacteria bacterium]|nr:dephospho-CoA kinase [Acidobacteriota bacterium]
MLRVGLTGSIAVGKSFVSQVLAELGCRVIDADEVARRVVEPGRQGLRLVAEAFGAEVVKEDGTLDRAKLGALVFGDEERRALLNSLLHPLIIAAQDEQLRRWEESDPRGIGVVDAALLIESGGYKRFDKMIVVHCRPEVQLERLMNRNNLSREEAERRIAAQMPQEEKLRYADFAVDTTGGFEDARALTEEVYGALRTFAAAAGEGPRGLPLKTSSAGSARDSE